MRHAESFDGVFQEQSATPVFFFFFGAQSEIQRRSIEWCYLLSLVLLVLLQPCA